MNDKSLSKNMISRQILLPDRSDKPMSASPLFQEGENDKIQKKKKKENQQK